MAWLLLLLLAATEPVFAFIMKVFDWLKFADAYGCCSVIEFKSRVGDRLAACFSCFYSSLLGFETFLFESYATLPKFAALAAAPPFMMVMLMFYCWPKSASLLCLMGVPRSLGAGELLFASGIGTLALSELEKKGFDIDCDCMCSSCEVSILRFFRAEPRVFDKAPCSDSC